MKYDIRRSSPSSVLFILFIQLSYWYYRFLFFFSSGNQSHTQSNIWKHKRNKTNKKICQYFFLFLCSIRVKSKELIRETTTCHFCIIKKRVVSRNNGWQIFPSIIIDDKYVDLRQYLHVFASHVPRFNSLKSTIVYK